MTQRNPAPSNLATLSEVPGTELRQLQATFESFREFVDRYSPWLSDSSIFVETLETVPVGAPVRLEIGLRDRPILIRALGQVDWVRTTEEEDEGPPGVALSINHLDTASTRLIDSIFRLYTGQQAAPMGEEVALNWEVDVESLIDDAFPGGATPAGTGNEAAAGPAEPPTTPKLPYAGQEAAEASPTDFGTDGDAASDGAAKPWSAPALTPLEIEDTPAAAGVVTEPPAPTEELKAPIVVVPEMPTVEPALEVEPELEIESTPPTTTEPVAAEPAVDPAPHVELLPPIDLEPAVDIEATPPAPDPAPPASEPRPPTGDGLTTQPMPAVPIDEPPPAAPTVEPPPPEVPAVAQEARPEAFEDGLSAAFSEPETVVEEPAPSFGFGLVEPPPETPAVEPEPSSEILPSLPAEATDSEVPPEPAPRSPAAPLPAPAAPAATAPPAAPVAMSRSDKSFLNRSVLVFLLVIAAVVSLFVIFRGRQASTPPAGGDVVARAPDTPSAEEPGSVSEPASPSDLAATPDAVQGSDSTATPDEPGEVATQPVAAEPSPAEPSPAEPSPAETTGEADLPPSMAAWKETGETEPDPGEAEAVPTADPAVAVAEVENAVNAWAAAWSAQRPEDFIASYGPTYSPSGLSRQQWESQRRIRIRAPVSITVRPKNLEVKLIDASNAVATFYQDYETDTKRLFTWKTMELSRLPEGWRIVAERSGR